MPDSKDEERDEEWFKEVYGKDYTGRTRLGNEMAREDSSSKKRAITQVPPEGDEEDAPIDPNAVPTDFTSREAKMWEAKAKAIERNWKKKKEEELICRICGEYGHFSQGCPTTLGVNRKQGEVIERVPVKDKRLKPRIIGTAGATIQGIERETGCRLQLEDNLTGGNGDFSVRISGKNHVMVGRAVDAVKKLIDQVQVDRKPHTLRKPHGPQNRVPNMDSLRAAQMQHVAHQRMQQDSSFLSHPGQDGPFSSDQYSNVEQLEASHPWESESQNRPYAYGYKGGSQYDDGRVSLKGTGNSRDQHHGSNVIDQQPIPKSLEALEHRFVEETMQLTKDVNDAEDNENARHREAMREIQEQFQQKMVTLRAQQAKRREEFLRHEAQLRQQEYQHYQQSQASPNYYSYDASGSLPGFNSGAREPLGYGLGLADRNESFAGYSSFRGEGVYYNNNTMRPYRNGAHESSMFHSGGSQSYDAGPYRY